MHSKKCALVLILVLISAVGTTNAKPLSITGKSNLKVSLNSTCESKNVKPTVQNVQVIAHKGKVMFAFTGEKIIFKVEANDMNGGKDISSVHAIIYNTNDTKTVNLKIVEVGKCKVVSEGSYLVKSKDYGKYILKIKVVDAHGLESEKTVGSLFLNPAVGVNIVPESIDFGKGAPGETSTKKVTIENLDPDNVGMSLKLLIKANRFVNENESFSPEYLSCNGKALSNNYIEIVEIPSKSKIDVSFELKRPIPLPVGNYTGNIDMEFVACANSYES